MTACGDKPEPPILTKPVIVENKPARSDMICAEEPKPPRSMKTDVEMTIWVEGVRKAGENCRAKLGVIRRTFYPSQ